MQITGAHCDNDIITIASFHFGSDGVFIASRTSALPPLYSHLPITTELPVDPVPVVLPQCVHRHIESSQPSEATA